MTITTIRNIAVLALVVGFLGVVLNFTGAPSLTPVPSFGAIGVKLAENYDPYIRYNQGFYTLLPIFTTSTLKATGLTTLTGGFVASSTGSTVNGINYGSCVLISDATTIAASTTANIDCGSGTNGKTAISGILANDTVIAFATTTLSSTYLGVNIVSSHASSTAGFITTQIANNSGAAFTWTNTASSSVRYIDFH